MKEIEALQALGFSLNEAKVYLALVNYSPLNGYEVAKRSGVTRTMVYDILRRLVAKEYVKRIEGSPTMYCAVDYRDLVQSLNTEHGSKIEQLEKLFAKLSMTSDEGNYVFNLKGGEEPLIDLLKQHICHAQKEIYLSIWDKEAEKIKNELKDAHMRGVEIHIFSFCKIPFEFGHQYSYNITNVQISDFQKAFPYRRVAAVFDKTKMIVGIGDGKPGDVHILTGNPMLINMAIDEMILDLLYLHAFKKFGDFKEDMSVADYQKASADFMKTIHIPPDIPSNNN